MTQNSGHDALLQTSIQLAPRGLEHTTQRSRDRFPSSPAIDAAADSVVRREQLIAAIRLSRSVADVNVDGVGAIVAFPTVVFSASGVHDLIVSQSPGMFAYGDHDVDATVEIGGLRISGQFRVHVGSSTEVVPAIWTAIDVATGHVAGVPSDLLVQLPTNVTRPALCNGTLVGSIRRTHLAAEHARRELLEMNRGLVRTVVNRFRGVVRSESSSLDINDLMIVGEHHLLQVVDRWYADPAQRPERQVAWSKLVQRAIGNAVRSEIARATGISVEFRQLLSWFHAHPEDRSERSSLVAQRMAFAAAVTRLMAKRGLHDRAAGVAALELMLMSGEARYVAPGRGAQSEINALRTAGVFVVSSRSSLAEIERAQSFGGAAVLTLDSEDESQERDGRLARWDDGYEDADHLDLVRQIIEQCGMTKIEALVWLHRSGALDPGGYGTELPDIADDLGLEGRGEARAALRRARRKLDAWASDDRRMSLVS